MAFQIHLKNGLLNLFKKWPSKFIWKLNWGGVADMQLSLRCYYANKFALPICK